MADRRHDPRPEARERRSFPRPPLWLNLLLLIIAAATFGYAKYQRDTIEQKSAILFKHTGSSPTELNRIRDELSDMDVTKQQLAKELDAKLQYLDTVHSEQFYISVDTRRKLLQLRLGKDVVREIPVELGAAKTLKSPSGKTWTFVPVKGSFAITGKQTDAPWQVPEWVYAMRNETAPADRPTVQNGLGRYVINLSDNYVIHTPPPPDSPLQGPKPGSIMVTSEADLAAIWPRITTATRVYIF